jgi:hypothetical protein
LRNYFVVFILGFSFWSISFLYIGSVLLLKSLLASFYWPIIISFIGFVISFYLVKSKKWKEECKNTFASPIFDTIEGVYKPSFKINQFLEWRIYGRPRDGIEQYYMNVAAGRKIQWLIPIVIAVVIGLGDWLSSKLMDSLIGMMFLFGALILVLITIENIYRVFFVHQWEKSSNKTILIDGTNGTSR